MFRGTYFCLSVGSWFDGNTGVILLSNWEEEWGAEELKAAAIDKMATYNNSFCGLGSYVILYHDFVELKYLPGTLVPFNMKQYKLDRGMPYSKIVFFLCVCWVIIYRSRGPHQWIRLRTLSLSKTRRMKMICLMFHRSSILYTNMNHPWSRQQRDLHPTQHNTTSLAVLSASSPPVSNDGNGNESVSVLEPPSVDLLFSNDVVPEQRSHGLSASTETVR